MLVTRQPVLRRFWYPVMPLELLEDGPKPFRLLGEDIVLWRTTDGRLVALEDRCCHRTAKLSAGWVSDSRITCGYHGWAYDETGRCVEVPRHPELIHGQRVRRFHSEVRYDHVWVALEEPLTGIPHLPEAEDRGYRVVPEFHEVWRCAALRVMENGFDNAHIQFVHRNTFGDQKDPVPALPTIVEHDFGFEMRATIKVWNNEQQKANLRDASTYTVRHQNTTWYLPFLRKLHIRYPSGLVHAIVTAATPIDDRHSQICQWAYRNDSEVDTPAANIIAFDRQVTLEDRAILESTDPDVPLALDSELEFHMPSDRPGMIMRKRLQALLAAHGEVEHSAHVGVRLTTAAD